MEATRRPLSTIDRLAVSWWFGDALLLVICGAVVALAALMTPSAEQLSFFGVDIPVVCTFRRLTGHGCPGCGLTRSFTFMAHLAPLEALRMNWLGPPLFVIVASQIPLRAWRLVQRWKGDATSVL